MICFISLFLMYDICTFCSSFQTHSAQVTSTISATLTSAAGPSSSKPPTSPLANLAASLFPSPVANIAKLPLKVSFRERIKNMQQDNSSSAKVSSADKEAAKNGNDKSDMKEQLITNTNISSSSSGSTTKHISKPSTLSIKEKIKQFGQSHHHIYPPKIVTASADDLPLKPWSKLKLATVVSTGGSYTSLNNSFNEGSPTERFTIPAAIVPQKKKSLPSDSYVAAAASTSERVCMSDSEFRITATISAGSGGGSGSGGIGPDSSTSISSGSSKSVPTKLKLKTQKTIRIVPSTDQQKNYRSVDDLSPEYSGLPFVKKLKILNERQKLAELESVIQTRSFSLDCTESGAAADIMEPLIRSHSEASGMGRASKANQVVGYQVDTCSTTTTPINIPSHQCLQSPLSPESNETLERRHLKSILKKLSEEKSHQQLAPGSGGSGSGVGGTADNTQDIKGLLRAPTLEGYVARHSKFMKSVTFNSTLSSPPNSASSAVEAIEERSLFPALSAQPINLSAGLTTTTTTASLLSPLSLSSAVVAATTLTATTVTTSATITSTQQSPGIDRLLESSTNRLQQQPDDTGQDINKLSSDLSPKRAPFLSKKFLKGK